MSSRGRPADRPAPDSRPRRIGLAADEPFALPLAVALRTVGETWSLNGAPVRALVLDGGLSERSRNGILQSLEGLPVEVRFAPVEKRDFEGLPLWRGLPFLSYARLLLPRLLAGKAERAVWLDADTLVRSDLSSLWDVDLCGRPVGACRDFAVPDFSSPLGIYEYRRVGDGLDHAYFNAGLLVYDLEVWRREEVTERTLAFLRRCRHEPVLADQEGLNVVLVNRWHPLDPLWNVVGGLFGRGFYDPPAFRRGQGPLDWRQARVVHFSGRIKPWRVRTASLYQVEYEAAMERTSLAHRAPEPKLRERLTGFYDRRLRRIGHPVEHGLIRFRRRLLSPWKLRLIPPGTELGP